MAEPEKRHDSTLAVAATAAAIIPVLVLCCAGPAVVVSLVAGIGAWFVGRSWIAVAAILIVAASIAYGITSWRRRRGRYDDQACGCGPAVEVDGVVSGESAAAPSHRGSRLPPLASHRNSNHGDAV